jgi:glycerol kinase
MLIGSSLFHSLSHILKAFTGISQYTNPSHIAPQFSRATLEANAFQTCAISMKLDSGYLKQLKVDGGLTNGDLTMSIFKLADIQAWRVTIYKRAKNWE